MGLAGEKRKQRLVGSAVTRNSAWLSDTSLPGQRLLSQMGWSEGQGIGGSGQGRTETIKTMYKMDNKGIGSQRAEKEMRDSGKAGVDRWTGGGGELGGLFERLNADASSSGTSTPAVEEILGVELDHISKPKVEKRKEKKRKREENITTSSSSESEQEPKRNNLKGKSREGSKKSHKSGDEESLKKRKKKKEKKSNKEKSMESNETMLQEEVEVAKAVQTIRNASRAKYLRAKRQLYGDSISMNEILGIASGSNSPAPSPQVIEADNSSPLRAVLTPDPPPNPPPATEVESDKERRRREKREKKERKAKKAETKEQTATVSPRPPSADDNKASARSLNEKEAVVNTVSSLSVHEYLSRKLMLRKAQMARKRKADQEAVWGRLSGVGGVGIMVE